MGRYDGLALRQALDKFLQDTAFARRAFDRDERAGVIFALVAAGQLAEYLRRRRRGLGVNAPGNLADPMFHLTNALEALDKGVVEPLLAPNPDATRIIVDDAADAVRGRKAGVSLSTLNARATAAAAMELCMRAGLTERAASQHVAARIKGSAVVASSRAKLENLPRAWRGAIQAQAVSARWEDVPSSEPDERRAAGMYNSLVADMEGMADRLGLNQAQRLAWIDAFLAQTSVLRPALPKSEMPPGF